MKFFLPLFSLITLLLSCEKQQNQKMLGSYLNFEVNGVKKSFSPADILNNNHFECQIKGDTSLNINVSQLFEGAGFTIKNNGVKDGTYELDNNNKAYYTNPKDFKRYSTNLGYKGTLTIKKNTFKAKTLLNTLEGQFSFVGEDTLTHKTFKITNGSFLMEVKVSE
jgi:hypothetical protein